MKIKMKWLLLLHQLRIVTLPRNKRIRYQVFIRDGCKCVSCGSKDNLTLDHKLPKSRGGKTGVDNLQTMCYDCNRKKGHIDYSPLEGIQGMFHKDIAALINYIENNIEENQLKLYNSIERQIFSMLMNATTARQLPLQRKLEVTMAKMDKALGEEKYRLQKAIERIKFKLKRVHETVNDIKNHTEYTKLKNFIRSRYGQKIIQEFYEQINKREEKIHTQDENPL